MEKQSSMDGEGRIGGEGGEVGVDFGKMEEE
eukprot:CAMPEP_0195032692 /NCGR_PEP_ID=MMETSP0326_2-20130528/64056_1 /TAXON_ID=2866 ORGANISM="Crypthecodinium cohnii, Strain Seligo" /NCGR_SAMPLE_ID=MMETSP0326_2 /ASSEMBLY_ACC=CAM_ASM_000348 /LENGTH=30 /DNA_ID= /DNA_START= /DNA_END= /DNA_ORIENTATION=